MLPIYQTDSLIIIISCIKITTTMDPEEGSNTFLYSSEKKEEKKRKKRSMGKIINHGLS